MNRIYYNMLYLAACGINGTKPDMAVLGEADIEQLYRISKAHQIDALVGTSVKNAGISLPKAWAERISKAIRKNILFDAERAKLLAFMEQNGIWHLPLKGIVLKEYYPAVGMRQMSDNDILFDSTFYEKVQSYMEQQGYECTSIGKGTHDVYQKAPVYNYHTHC